MAQPDLYSFLTGLLGGGIVASVVTHRLALNRESRDRKIDFLGFLGRWLGATRQSPPSDVSGAYAEFMPHLWGYHAKLRRDFIFKSRFKTLCEDLGSMKPEELTDAAGDCRVTLGRKIEALIEFV